MNKMIGGLMLASGMMLGASAALACGGMGGACPAVEGHFKALDSNKDGFISKKEFDAEHIKRFKEMDANKDGKLSLAEMQAAHDGKRAERRSDIQTHFDEADADHDGALTKAEAEGKMPMLSAHFDEMDANKDGKVTHDEIRSVMKEMHHRRGLMMPQSAPQAPKQ